MKKRRELDALVGNGKLPRRKSKSGHELLRSDDSDSSEVEEFSIKIGKKSDRKWAGFCSCSTCLGLTGFVILMVCFITCSGLIWLHFELKRDLDNLRERIVTVENHGQAVPEDLQVVKRQVQTINKTVQDLKKENKETTEVVNGFNQQLASLIVDVNSLKESLKEAPELKELPNRIETLSSSLATLGSDVQLAKKIIDDLKVFQDSTNQQLRSLTDRITNVEALSSNISLSAKERSNESDKQLVNIPQVVNELGQQIFSVNNTLQSAVSALSQRIVELENTTDTHKTLESLLFKVDNITNFINHQLEENKADLNNTKTAQPAVSDFTEFKKITQSEIKALNGTVFRLNDKVSNLSLQFTRINKNLVNMSSVVDGMFYQLSSLNLQNESTTLEQFDETNTPGLNDTYTTAQPSSSVSLRDILTSNQPESRIISIKIPDGETIDNKNKLDKYFNRWDTDGDGLVLASDLPNFLGSAAPNEELLHLFDKNHDGKYSLSEFANALGIKDRTW